MAVIGLAADECRTAVALASLTEHIVVTVPSGHREQAEDAKRLMQDAAMLLRSDGV